MEKSKPKEKHRIMRPSEQLSISSRNRFCSSFNLVLLHTLAFGPYTGWDSFLPGIFLSILLPKWCPFNNPSHTSRGLSQQQHLRKHTNLKREFAFDDLVRSCGISGIWLTPVHLMPTAHGQMERVYSVLPQTQSRWDKCPPHGEAEVVLNFGACDSHFSSSNASQYFLSFLV